MSLRTVMLIAVLSLILAGCTPAQGPTQTADTVEQVSPTSLPEPTVLPTIAPTDVPTVAPTPTDPPVPPTGDGKALMEERCSVCHSVDRILSARKTAEGWAESVTRMIGHGAVLTADEQSLLIQYLADTYK